jgi:hypothetical protein
MPGKVAISFFGKSEITEDRDSLVVWFNGLLLAGGGSYILMPGKLGIVFFGKSEIA